MPRKPIIPRKLTFEDFRFKPSESEQQKHRAAIRHVRCKLIVPAITEKDKALIDALRMQLPKAELSERKVLPKHNLRKWLERIPAPNPPRLPEAYLWPGFGLCSINTGVAVPLDWLA